MSKEYGHDCVQIDGINIEIDLREASKRIPPTTNYGSSEYVPTGEFIFKVLNSNRSEFCLIKLI